MTEKMARRNAVCQPNGRERMWCALFDLSNQIPYHWSALSALFFKQNGLICKKESKIDFTLSTCKLRNTELILTCSLFNFQVN